MARINKNHPEKEEKFKVWTHNQYFNFFSEIQNNSLYAVSILDFGWTIYKWKDLLKSPFC